jgi:hypothetical protein
MPGAIHNYWLGIMALAFALAIVAWIGLVFNAGRHPSGRRQESWPHREVMGGSFTAFEGGRQVMPEPAKSPEPEATSPGPTAASPEATAASPEAHAEARPEAEAATVPAPREEAREEAQAPEREVPEQRAGEPQARQPRVPEPIAPRRTAGP